MTESVLFLFICSNAKLKSLGTMELVDNPILDFLKTNLKTGLHPICTLSSYPIFLTLVM